MKLYLIIILILFFTQVCQSQTNEKKDYTEVISSRFKENDSLSIQIIYDEQIGCLGGYVGKITIKSFNGKLSFYHVSSNPDRDFEAFRTTNKNTLDLIKDFEIKGKNSEKVWCGGTGVEGHGFKIKLNINDKETQFV